MNPADTYNRARVADNYLWQIARKLQGYRYEAHVNVSHGTTVVRVTIARDGRLLDVEVAGSSGVPEFDRGVLAGRTDQREEIVGEDRRDGDAAHDWQQANQLRTGDDGAQRLQRLGFFEAVEHRTLFVKRWIRDAEP